MWRKMQTSMLGDRLRVEDMTRTPTCLSLHHCSQGLDSPAVLWLCPTPVDVGCLHPGGRVSGASVQAATTLEQSSSAQCLFC